MLDRGPGEIIPHPLGTALSADSGIYPEDNQAGPQLGGSQVGKLRSAWIGTMVTRALPLTSPCRILRIWRYSSPSRAWPR